MRASPKQERSKIRTIEQLLRRYDLEAIASIKAATENNVTGLNKTMATLEQFIDATVGSLENMQSQIDGSISTWFYEGEPTLENSPANEWISDTEKQAHLGDLYYDKDTGYGYRFSVTEDTYEWIKITDSDVVEALAVANAAQDTADGKRRVFVAKPKPPYDEGDLWFNDEEIYICCVTKTTGEYVEDDFIIATKYTDDTKALEVEKNLNLVVARVDILQTTALTAESAVIRELQTNMLTSESAIIKELQTQVTKTETLIFGAAGGTSIQTEFSNAVIAMLGDAQIKSAMIDSVSASKVTSGTILTNDVTIQSEDGKTVLKDNTLQISDGTKVRVQIGKDASGDYSINVWDASGNLMFSEGGITDSAIKEAIIRDDMVSDNANINAAKLDIDSLFEEINGSSKTIKSTKVYFDSEKQTLDAAFKSMTTTVSGIQSTQSSQGTQITAIQGQITSKIWQEDINTAVDEVEGDISTLSTKYTTLNQTVNGLSSTVGSHTTQINSLDTRVDSAESNITQHANLISLRVEKSGVISAINQSAENIKISAAKIELEGAVTFSSFDSATQELINDTTYSVTGSMSGIGSGTATVEIYKNGVLCTESLFLSMTYLDGSGGTTWKTSSYGGTVSTGQKTWTYSSVRAYKIEIYADSTKAKFLCGCILSYGATGATGATGSAGANGEDGLGVKSIVEQYYLSSSSTSQTGGSWSTTCPAWKSGYYIWTRSYITWSDSSTTTTTAVLASGLNSANTNANTAISTANTANDTAADALAIANTASSNASSALSTANTASTNATSALNRATYHYGTCSTAAGTAAKAVTLSNFSLYTGAMVSVYFSNANTASSPTLNVNSTGAKSIRVNNAEITSKYYWRAKDTVTFIYNGTYWVMADTSANSLLASWCSDNDKTLIDGGKIYASDAFLQNIFSKNITATGTITGLTYVSEGSSASERVEIKNGILTVGSSAINIGVANGGLGFTYNGISAGAIRNNMSQGGIEIAVPDGKMFDITCGGKEVLSINKNASYQGFMNITYPLMCNDIYPVNVDCMDIVCSDVRIRNGVSLSELNSNLIYSYKKTCKFEVNANTSEQIMLGISLPQNFEIVGAHCTIVSNPAWWIANIGSISNTVCVVGVRNLYDTALTTDANIEILYKLKTN